METEQLARIIARLADAHGRFTTLPKLEPPGEIHFKARSDRNLRNIQARWNGTDPQIEDSP